MPDLPDNKILDYASSDPDAYRMSLGDHLEELRSRLIYSILGFVVALVVCLFFGKNMMSIFCRPLFDTLRDADISPQIYFTNIGDPFMVYLEISMISALVISSPWIIWQAWKFIAAGLYANERKTVTKYVPLSITLMLSGVAFVYWLVLPWTLQFFLAFSISIPMPEEFNPISTTAPTSQIASNATKIEALPGDPGTPLDNQIWYNTVQNRMKFNYAGKIRAIQFGPESLTSPIVTLPDYIDLVFGMIATFALSFQMPLVVMALAKIGIVEVKTLKGARRIVYFIMAVVAAVITPGDVITATVALMIPLCLLFELGILLAGKTKSFNSSDLSD